MTAGQIVAVAFLAVVVVLVLRGIRGHQRTVRPDGDAGLGPLGTGPTGDVAGGDGGGGD